jgi:hypothetical protein
MPLSLLVSVSVRLNAALRLDATGSHRNDLSPASKLSAPVRVAGHGDDNFCRRDRHG